MRVQPCAAENPEENLLPSPSLTLKSIRSRAPEVRARTSGGIAGIKIPVHCPGDEKQTKVLGYRHGL